MRAPPDAEKTIAGTCRSSARSNTRVTFSPTTEPIEPPMNSNTKKPSLDRLPFDQARADQHRVRAAGVAPRRAQPVRVALRVPEPERIDALDGRVRLGEGARIEHNSSRRPAWIGK